MRKDYLIFGNVDTRDYKVWISGKGVFAPPEREYERYNVPGRNGDLLIDKKRYGNSTIPYEAFIVKQFVENMDAFRNALMAEHGYQRLEDTIHPDEYRMAMIMPFSPEIKGTARAGTFIMEFNCKPQRYLKSGEEAVEFLTSGVLYNDTLFEAKPLIRVYGNGTLGVGSETFSILGNTSYIDIDCEVEDVYRGAENMNGNVIMDSGEFPILRSGMNGIAFGAGITRVIIKPRWWII